VVKVKRKLVVATKDVPVGEVGHESDHASGPLQLDLFLGGADVFFGQSWAAVFENVANFFFALLFLFFAADDFRRGEIALLFLGWPLVVVDCVYDLFLL